MDYTDKIAEFQNYLKQNMSPDRFSHSLRTAWTARAYAERFGCEPEKAFFAGLVHDIGREMPEDRILELAGLNIVDPGERRSAAVLFHGKASAVFLNKEWKLADREILNAVEYHTTGHPDMDKLAKIIYISDVMEPGRRYHHEVRSLDNGQVSLDELLGSLLERSIRHLEEKGCQVDKRTLDLYRKLTSDADRHE